MAVQTPDGLTIRNIYVDESSQTAHRYLVLGGIICCPDVQVDIEKLFWEARGSTLPAGELKWTKVSPSKLDGYRRVVEVFWNNVRIAPVFHCAVVDTHKRNETFFNGGSREIGFNKEIYQLLMKFGRTHKGYAYHVFPDERQTSSTTEDLRMILNQGVRKKQGRSNWPFRRVHFRSSHDEPMLQLTDLLIGALAFRLNGHRHMPEASKAKCELSDYVLDLAGIKDVFTDTSIVGRFTIWHRQLRRVPQS